MPLLFQVGSESECKVALRTQVKMTTGWVAGGRCEGVTSHRLCPQKAGQPSTGLGWHGVRGQKESLKTKGSQNWNGFPRQDEILLDACRDRRRPPLSPYITFIQSFSKYLPSADWSIVVYLRTGAPARPPVRPRQAQGVWSCLTLSSEHFVKEQLLQQLES